MRNARRFIQPKALVGVFLAVSLSWPASLPGSSRSQLVTITQMGSNSVHVRRTSGAFWDTMDLGFDRVRKGVHIEGTYRSSKGGELRYRAQVTREGGYVEIFDLQEIFTVSFAKQDFRGQASYKLVSIGFGGKEVAVDEQQLERNLPHLIEIVEGLKQSRMLPLILDSQSLIQAMQQKLGQRSAKRTSFSLVQEVLAAGCFWEFLECSLAAIGYAANIAGMLTCAAPTPACVLNILAHPGAALALAVECSEWVAECVK